MKTIDELHEELNLALDRKLISAVSFHPGKNNTVLCLWLLPTTPDDKVAQIEQVLKQTYNARRVESMTHTDRGLIVCFDEQICFNPMKHGFRSNAWKRL